MTEFNVERGDITKVSSDVLILKHAEQFYGVDALIANILIESRLCSEEQIRPHIDEFVIIETKGVIAPTRVMFLGTPSLLSFSYDQMHHFSQRAIEALTIQNFPIKLLTITVHGVNYGLDGAESLQSLVRGFQKGLANQVTSKIAKISFVEQNERMARILSVALDSMKSLVEYPTLLRGSLIEREYVKSSDHKFIHTKQRQSVFSRQFPISESATQNKRHVFVAMPFSEEFQDIYEYGIYGPVRECGLICEKTNETAYTGDILRRIRERIETADLVIADLSESRPNVYLEVGYAWGKGVPVIFLIREEEKLHFDVSTHRCIYYKSIRQLAKELGKLIRGLYDIQDEQGHLRHDVDFNPPLPGIPMQAIKDTMLPTRVVIEYGYFGILSSDDKESGRIDLYKHSDVNENGEYVYTFSRAIHGDDYRTIELPEDNNLVTRGVHAKLFVNKTTGEFKIAQYIDYNPVLICKNKGENLIKLKKGDIPVVLEDKDVITVGRSRLILHKYS